VGAVILVVAVAGGEEIPSDGVRYRGEGRIGIAGSTSEHDDGGRSGIPQNTVDCHGEGMQASSLSQVVLLVVPAVVVVVVVVSVAVRWSMACFTRSSRRLSQSSQLEDGREFNRVVLVVAAVVVVES